jgi:probable rRNA maturation factor
MKAPRPALALSLQFADPSHRELLPRHQLARWLRAALDAPARLTVRIVGSEEGRALNRTYRGKDYATNVLTFAYGDDDGAAVPEGDHAGARALVADLVLCAPVIEREATEQGKTLQAHYAHLLVHGALHAQGHDHEAEAEAEAMEGREREVLATLGFDDPYG